MKPTHNQQMNLKRFTDANKTHWQQLKHSTRNLHQALDNNQLDLRLVLVSFENLAKALLHAVVQEQLSSTRLQCVVRALNLSVPKPKLQQFLED